MKTSAILGWTVSRENRSSGSLHSGEIQSALPKTSALGRYPSTDGSSVRRFFLGLSLALGHEGTKDHRS